MNIDHIKVAGSTLIPYFETGEVLEIKVSSHTHVFGGGGGGGVSTDLEGKVSGRTSPITINSKIEKETSIWIKNSEGEEKEWKVPGGVSARAGHKLILSSVFKGDKGYIIAITNQTTGKLTTITNQGQLIKLNTLTFMLRQI